MGDVMPVPTVADLRSKAQNIEGGYLSVAKINPAYDSCNYQSLQCVNEEPKMTLVDLFEYLQICWDHDKKHGLDTDRSLVWTLFRYLGVASILSLRQLCRSASRLATLEVQCRAVQFGGLEDNIRVHFWVSQAPFFDLQTELKSQLKITGVFANLLEEILQRIKANALDKKLLHQISVDIQRTRNLETNQPFGPEETRSLNHILQALAYVFPEIGYCQGMNYIAATLFASLKDAELTFNVFTSLLVHRSLLPLFRNQVPEFHLRNHVLSGLIKEHFPLVHAHFKRFKLELSVLTAHWLMTLFCGYLSHKVVLAILDNFFLEGWPAIYRVSLAIVKRCQAELLALQEFTLLAQKVHKLREEMFASLTAGGLMEDAQALDKELVFGVREADGSYAKLEALEHEFFMA